MEILTTTSYICACILLFSLAIAIHEFGHFIVALKLGLKVEAFSIGFGPVLWRKSVNGVEYRISAIPLGGYVLIPDIDPEGTKALEGGEKGGSSGSAKNIPAWKEILVAVAGPAMNIVLAVVLAVVLSIAPGAKFGELPATIGFVPEFGPAAEAGLMAGDTVISVGGNAVDTYSNKFTDFIFLKYVTCIANVVKRAIFIFKWNGKADVSYIMLVGNGYNMDSKRNGTF